MVIKFFYGELDNERQNGVIDGAIEKMASYGISVEEYEDMEFSGIPKPVKKPRKVKNGY